MWATIEDVLNITGVDITLTPEKLNAANSIVQLHTGVLDTATVHTRDAEWLRQAVAWQAAWAAGQADLQQRSSATSVSQDGLSATLKDEAAVILAPAARRAIKNLSWMGSRSVLMSRRATGHRKTTDVDPPDHAWSPIATGA